MNAQYFLPNGKKAEIKLGHPFTLDELQGLVEGYIEILEMANGNLFIFNEEGKIKDMPINKEATNLWHDLDGDPQDELRGPVIYCTPDCLESEKEVPDIKKHSITRECPECGAEMWSENILVAKSSGPHEEDRFEQGFVCSGCDHIEV